MPDQQEKTFGDAWEDHDEAMEKALQDSRAGMVQLPQALKAWLKDFEAEQKDPNAGRVAMTGIKDLDAKTKLRAGEMTIIAGRPGMGKSALAMQVALSVAKNGGTVAVFSLEMSSSALIHRLVGASSGVNLRERPQPHEWDKILRACNELGMEHFWINDRSGQSVEQMHRAMLEVEKPKLIVVDYIGLMAEDKNAQRHDLAVGFNARDIRAMAKDFGAHAIALCQLNRKVEERNPPRPQLSDLRDSGNLEEHADSVWMIYREGYYKHGEDDNTADIQIEKQRQGERGIVKVAWQGKFQRFADLARRSNVEDWKYGNGDTHD